MKKNGFLAIIAMAALSFAACNKEGLPQNDATDLPSDEPVVETPVVLEPGVYPATVVAEPIMPDLAGTKAVFDNGAFAWEAGDAIACFQHFELLNEAETNVITRMTTAAGDGNFAGSLPYTESETYLMNFIHPASVAIQLVSVGTNQKYEQLEINLPNEQDGRLENLGNYFIAGKAKVSCVVSNDDPDNISITTENVILNKYPVFAVKVDVPEAFNAQSIKIEALRNADVLGLAGKSYLNVNNCQHKGPQTYPSAEYLTISHNDDSQISGDTYGVMMPYAKDKSDPCTVNKIKFTVTTSSSQTYTFAKSVSELRRGNIYDLGTFPTSCVTPKFSFDENGAVVMTSSPAEAKIYYTTDGSDPSAEATLYQGPVEITADTQFKAVAICEGLGNSAVAEELMYGSVVAPVVKIDASGRLTIESIGGHTYKYSISSDGNIPSDPEDDFPTDGLEIATGSHMIKVMATNAAGEVAVTNVYYRVVAAVGEQFDLSAGASNSVAMAPFTITNTSEIDYTFRISSSGWYFGGTAGTSVSSNITKIQVGLKLQYPSVASLYVKENAAGKRVYLTYKGVAADHGSSTKTWGEMWNSGSSCSAGDDFFFRLANGSILKGFGLLEQGFESFNPTAASLSSEAPAAGQNVAY